MNPKVSVYAAPAFQAYPEFQSLMRDFKTYKQRDHTTFEHFKFGKDVPYHWPQSAKDAELSHVHLLPINAIGNTSDRFLVYSRGFTNPNAYVVLAILEPDAHNQSRNTLIMCTDGRNCRKFSQSVLESKFKSDTSMGGTQAISNTELLKRGARIEGRRKVASMGSKQKNIHVLCFDRVKGRRLS